MRVTVIASHARPSAVEDATVPLLRRQLWDEVEAQAARECREAKAGRS